MAVTDVVKGQTIVTHTINADNFKHCLMTFGEKMTEAEIDDVFDEFDYDDDGLILTKSVVDMFVAGDMNEIHEERRREEEEDNVIFRKATRKKECSLARQRLFGFLSPPPPTSPFTRRTELEVDRFRFL